MKCYFYDMLDIRNHMVAQWSTLPPHSKKLCGFSLFGFLLQSKNTWIWNFNSVGGCECECKRLSNVCLYAVFYAENIKHSSNSEVLGAMHNKQKRWWKTKVTGLDPLVLLGQWCPGSAEMWTPC